MLSLRIAKNGLHTIIIHLLIKMELASENASDNLLPATKNLQIKLILVKYPCFELI